MLFACNTGHPVYLPPVQTDQGSIVNVAENIFALQIELHAIVFGSLKLVSEKTLIRLISRSLPTDSAQYG